MQIADYFQSGGVNPDEYAVGLQNEFQPLEGQDIGQFPGLESENQRNEAEEYHQLTRWSCFESKKISVVKCVYYHVNAVVSLSSPYAWSLFMYAESGMAEDI